MGGRIERYFIPVAIGFAPFAMLLLTWAPEGRTLFQILVLRFQLPIVAVELFVIAIAAREGLMAAMRRWSWPLVPTCALLLLLAVAIATAIVAPNPPAARFWTLLWIVHLLFGFSITHLSRSEEVPRDIIAAYVAGFFVFVIGIFLSAAFVRDPAFDWVSGWPAVTHIRHFGYYAAAIIGLCIGLGAADRSPLVRTALLLLSTVGFTFVWWTGSRGAIIAIVGALLIGVVVIPAVRRVSVWGGALLGLLVGALIANQLPAHGPLMGFSRTVTQTVGSGDVSTGRTVLWLNALGAIRQRPIFGYGENQMATVAPFYGLGQTHNVVLQILLAWGIVGLICAGVLAVWFLMRSLPALRHRPTELAPPFIAMAALTSLATIDGSLFHVIPVSIFAACAGIFAANWRSDPSQ